MICCYEYKTQGCVHIRILMIHHWDSIGLIWISEIVNIDVLTVMQLKEDEICTKHVKTMSSESDWFGLCKTCILSIIEGTHLLLLFLFFNFALFAGHPAKLWLTLYRSLFHCLSAHLSVCHTVLNYLSRGHKSSLEHPCACFDLFLYLS